MDKLNRLLKNILVFTVVFILINYVFQAFGGKNDELALNQGNIVFSTTETEYSRPQIVTAKLLNGTKEDIFIKNECPNEPFKVYKFENNEWIEKTASPELDCSAAKDVTIKPGQEVKIPYLNWNHVLFSEMGRFKIEFVTNIDSKDVSFTSNEFVVVKESVIKQLWYGIFYRPIYNGLIFLTSVMPMHDLGLAIILLTIIIRTILLLPSQKSMKAQKKMQEIQPKLEKIKEKYKGDQQRIAMETMNIWKEAKVSPFGSCLPLLLQFPFLIALFYTIQNGLNPDQSYLLYTNYVNFGIHDISVNFFGLLDLTKVNLYVLPLIVGGLQFIQMKLTIPKKSPGSKSNEMAMASNMMVYIMPVMIAVFTASLPAGVGIYWGVSTTYGIFQQLVVNKSKPGKSDEPSVKVIEN